MGFFAPVAGALLGRLAGLAGRPPGRGRHGGASSTSSSLLDPLGELIRCSTRSSSPRPRCRASSGSPRSPPDRVATGAVPRDDHLEVEHVRYAYRDGQDVLHGVSLDLRPGERLAVVGPSGAGKSTLGRLLAGIDGPRAGRITVGGVPLVDLELDALRGQVALVTQEHHVFVGTLAENLRLARPGATDEDLRAALDAVDALDWAERLPEGLGDAGRLRRPRADRGPGPAGGPGPARPRRPAHPRPRRGHLAARPPGGAAPRAVAGAVLTGRTVVAIAHRLHTAHDADRVAVVETGASRELGSHDELLAADGDYAALWRSWRDEG